MKNRMKTFLLTAVIGIMAGLIDILPMLKMKLDKYAISSAFVFYFIMPFFIFNINLFGMAWWLKGAVLAFVSALPVMIIVAKSERKSLLPMAFMAILLGTFIGVAGHLFNIS